MKSIVLIRHGKSSWNHNVIDRERPLNPRGKKDVKLVANQFIKTNDIPKKIYSSPAKRALNTSKIFMKAFSLSENSVEIKENLYDFGGENVIDFIKNLSNEIDYVMIFGHNHAFTSIANIFGNKFFDNLPTSGLVKINFDIDNWKDLKKGHTKLILIPKELK